MLNLYGIMCCIEKQAANARGRKSAMNESGGALVCK